MMFQLNLGLVRCLIIGLFIIGLSESYAPIRAEEVQEKEKSYIETRIRNVEIKASASPISETIFNIPQKRTVLEVIDFKKGFYLVGIRHTKGWLSLRDTQVYTGPKPPEKPNEASFIRIIKNDLGI